MVISPKNTNHPSQQVASSIAEMMIVKVLSVEKRKNKISVLAAGGGRWGRICILPETKFPLLPPLSFFVELKFAREG